MNRWQQTVRRTRAAAATVILIGLLLACTGCAGLGLSSGEQDLLDRSTAEARFMDRSWAARSPAEQADFVHQNALRWQYFADLAHGRQPAASEEDGQ